MVGSWPHTAPVRPRGSGRDRMGILIPIAASGHNLHVVIISPVGRVGVVDGCVDDSSASSDIQLGWRWWRWRRAHWSTVRLLPYIVQRVLVIL
jgi:hypothetical protein